MNKPIGGTFTLTFGAVTSSPLRFDASQKLIDRTMHELADENAAVIALRKKWRARRRKARK